MLSQNCIEKNIFLYTYIYATDDSQMIYTHLYKRLFQEFYIYIFAEIKLR